MGIRKKRRYSLESIILGLIVVPPLGFFFLWSNSKTRRGRATVVLLFLLVVSVGIGAYMRFGLPWQPKVPPIPPEGFNVSHDERGHYRDPRILDLEWKIFRRVVQETHRLQRLYEPIDPNEDLTVEMSQPEYKAFQIVAEETDMFPEDVKAIYLKVSTLLTEASQKQKK